MNFNKKLSTILNFLGVELAVADVSISGLSMDSQSVQAGDLFLAIGRGHQYISQAKQQGAQAILTDNAQSEGIFVAHLSENLSHLANWFYDNPSQNLTLFAITGTNGKTTCCHLLAQALQLLGIKSALIGTNGHGLLGQLSPPSLTTPNVIQNIRLLAEFKAQGVQAVAMEASSHALVQNRLQGLQIYAAGFTNLTQDHLDYHQTLAAYKQAKRLLFSHPGLRHAVFNIDDSSGQQWFDELQSKLDCYAVTQAHFTHAELLDQQAVLSANILQTSVTEQQVYLTYQQQTVEANLAFLGKFNVSNVLIVVALLLSYRFSLADIQPILAQLHVPKGRMQPLSYPNKPSVIVDFAHTPDALENVLTGLRSYCQGKLICVFGCGGDRDKDKRPQMGKIVADNSDFAIVTSDNPRHESAEVIADMIVAAMPKAHYQIELDRYQAIYHAIQLANQEDLIVIAGKGHEAYQQIGDDKFPFDDIEVVKQIFSE